MTKRIRGKVDGKAIELDEDIGVANGQEVEVQIKVISLVSPWGDGILRTAGALADDPYWGAIMEEVQLGRKIERGPKCRANDSTRPGHEHLFRPHAASRRLGSSVLSNARGLANSMAVLAEPSPARAVAKIAISCH